MKSKPAAIAAILAFAALLLVPAASATHWCSVVALRMGPDLVTAGAAENSSIYVTNDGLTTLVLSIEVRYDWEESFQSWGRISIPADRTVLVTKSKQFTDNVGDHVAYIAVQGVDQAGSGAEAGSSCPLAARAVQVAPRATESSELEERNLGRLKVFEIDGWAVDISLLVNACIAVLLLAGIVFLAARSERGGVASHQPSLTEVGSATAPSLQALGPDSKNVLEPANPTMAAKESSGDSFVAMAATPKSVEKPNTAPSNSSTEGLVESEGKQRDLDPGDVKQE